MLSWLDGFNNLYTSLPFLNSVTFVLEYKVRNVCGNSRFLWRHAATPIPTSSTCAGKSMALQRDGTRTLAALW